MKSTLNNMPLALLCIMLCGLCSGCSQADSRAQSLPTISMQVGNRPATLEVARTDGEHEIGLMYRESMPADHGMIFIFNDEEVRSFWMRNTWIPLDIVYADAAGRIVAIKAMKPRDLSSVSSDKPAKYAIELNVGEAQTRGLKVGDVLRIPADIDAAIRQNAQGSGNPATAPSTRP